MFALNLSLALLQLFLFAFATARPVLHHPLPPFHTDFLSRTRIPPSAPSSLVAAKTIYQSATGLFFENIAVRADSTLLLTSVVSSSLHGLDPSASETNKTLATIATFSNATSLTGIVELPSQPGVFVVAASVTDNTTRRTEPGSIVLWSVDLTLASTPMVSVFAALPQAASVNGLTVLPASSTGGADIVLAADSVLGGVWQAGSGPGQASARLALQDPTMLANAPPPTLGINGLHVVPGSNSTSQTLLYTTSGQSALFSVPLSIGSGNVSAAAAVEKVADFGTGQAPDDFAVDAKGNAWVAVHPGDLVFVPVSGIERTGRKGNGTVVLGNAQGTDTRMDQPTSAAFGRGSAEQEKTLYVTTGLGAIARPGGTDGTAV
ncbi:hypothetical protein C8F01DRAFT_1122952 [Mycena amicta]|nr:hypothetical protein C8F01DRAFT_1122952 [Mycena amicta]